MRDKEIFVQIIDTFITALENNKKVDWKDIPMPELLNEEEVDNALIVFDNSNTDLNENYPNHDNIADELIESLFTPEDCDLMFYNISLLQTIETFKSRKALYNNIELQKTLLILIAMTYLTIEKYKSSQKEVNNG
ncbi:MAG TPA: hypothetical protein PLU55_04830 [Candidatus Pacearchaeota archaeon]|nr:hypothetical protein [Candidatus Pacearchaeota archaeon]